MSRFSDAPVNTALAAQHVRLVMFAQLEFDTATSRIHNSIGTYTWGGNDWLGVGDFDGVSSIEEGRDVSPYGVTLTLSPLPQYELATDQSVAAASHAIRRTDGRRRYISDRRRHYLLSD